VLVGFGAGILAGLFGVGGGTVTTPAVHVLLGGTALQAIATPLRVIVPTSLGGAYTSHRAGEVSWRAAKCASPPGMVGAAIGAALSDVVNPHWLLLLTAVLLAWTAWQVVSGRRGAARERGATPGWHYGAVGLVAGFVSGLLGLGGGIVMVPALTTLLGMPLKRALGTSLVVISALVVPGTIVHWALGHIDWAIFLVLAVGVAPGARIGAKIALGARERTLRLAVGSFLFAVAVLYGARELAFLARSRG
jgi:uncharacterized membrane protein YfcA